MRRNLSIYLDLLRLCAAAAVMLSHARVFLMPRGLPPALTGYGPEAVAIFFVLSGFLIRFTTSGEVERDWRRYASARAARIYPVVVLALAVTILADAIGTAASPGTYAGAAWFAPGTDLGALLRALSFTNEVWYAHAIFGSDEPFWSLGFEIPYYVLFGLLFVPPRWRAPAVLGWAAIVGPKIMLYLPLWLLGVAAHDLHRHARIRPFAGAAGFVAALAAVPLIKEAMLHGRVVDAFRSSDATAMIAGALYFLAIATAAAVSIVALDAALHDRAPRSPRLAGGIRWLAGGSFTLYLVHLPIMAAIVALFPGVRDRPASGIAAIAATLAIAYLLAELAERRKPVFRHRFDRLFRVGKPHATPRITHPIHPVAPPSPLL